MPVKNLSYDMAYYVEDLQNGGGVTLDSTNHTLRLLVDGVLEIPSGTISEPDPTYMKGWYRIHLHDDENTGDIMVLGGNSSTGSVEIRGVQWFNEPLSRKAIVDSNIVQVSGEYVNINNFISGSDVTESGIAYSVWEEQLSNHTISGSAGQALITASGVSGGGDTSGLATTAQLEYWALMILNNCGGGAVG